VRARESERERVTERERLSQKNETERDRRETKKKTMTEKGTRRDHSYRVRMCVSVRVQKENFAGGQRREGLIRTM